MPAGDLDFCNHYEADPNVQTWIDDPTSCPPEFADFFGRYRRWIDEGRKAGFMNMLAVFKEITPAEQALNDGDTSAKKSAGRVLKVDCGAFNTFVGEGHSFRLTAGEIESLRREFPSLSGNKDLDAWFISGLKKYFVGDVDKLSLAERGALNGALFVQLDLASSSFGSGQSDRRMFAIPGPAFYYDYGRPLTGLWGLIDERITDAFEKAGTRRINVTGVAQLRLGTDTDVFGPVDVGSGFVIKGRV